MKQQTAVEWFIEEFKKEPTRINLEKLAPKANELFEKQIINAINFGDERGKITTYKSAEQYYNETYKNQ